MNWVTHEVYFDCNIYRCRVWTRYPFRDHHLDALLSMRHCLFWQLVLGAVLALRAHCAHVATLLLNHVWKQMDLSNLKLNCLRIAILLVDIAKSGSLNFP